MDTLLISRFATFAMIVGIHFHRKHMIADAMLRAQAITSHDDNFSFQIRASKWLPVLGVATIIFGILITCGVFYTLPEIPDSDTEQLKRPLIGGITLIYSIAYYAAIKNIVRFFRTRGYLSRNQLCLIEGRREILIEIKDLTFVRLDAESSRMKLELEGRFGKIVIPVLFRDSMLLYALLVELVRLNAESLSPQNLLANENSLFPSDQS